MRPFVRWAGGKRFQAQQIVDYLGIHGKSFEGIYYEPFLGGGAVALLGQPKAAVLSDNLEPLINTWQAVRDHPVALSAYLSTKQAMWATMDDDGKEAAFYKTRELWNADPLKPGAFRASQFIWLNRTCFNGIWRQNKKGEFNVPFGQISPHIPSSIDILKMSKYLKQTGVVVGKYHFTEALLTVEDDDAVYLDPPYLPEKATSFVGYINKFEEHEKVFQVAAECAKRGARVVLSNSVAPAAKLLALRYLPDWEIVPVARKTGVGRRPSKEQLFVSPRCVGKC